MLRKLVCTFIPAAALWLFACGGDSNSPTSKEDIPGDIQISEDEDLEEEGVSSETVESSSSAKDEEFAVVVDSEDDLPNCTSNREGTLAKVDKDLFLCKESLWTSVKATVEKICDIPLCNEKLKGGVYYLAPSKAYFSCDGKVWTGADGTEMSMDEYKECHVLAAVQETVGSEDDLLKCTEKREGVLFMVDDAFMFCIDGEWSKLSKVVVTPEEAPECTASRQGKVLYVVSDEAAYKCSDEVWVNGDKQLNVESPEVEPGENSSDSEPASTGSDVSSSSKSEPSSNVSSSSKPASSSSVVSSSSVISGGSSTHGACAPVSSSVVRGSNTKWTFSRGSELSAEEFLDAVFEWSFEGASIASALGASPSVSYLTMGTYNASVRVNGSEPIQCSPIEVKGASISCDCSYNDEYVDIVGSATASWNVSCSSIASIQSLNWTGADGSDGFTAVKTVTAVGTVSGPTITATNADDVTTSVTCPSVKAVDSTKLAFTISPSSLDNPELGPGTYTLYFGCSNILSITTNYMSSTVITWVTDTDVGEWHLDNVFTTIDARSIGLFYDGAIAVKISGGNVKFGCW